RGESEAAHAPGAIRRPRFHPGQESRPSPSIEGELVAAVGVGYLGDEDFVAHDVVLVADRAAPIADLDATTVDHRVGAELEAGELEEDEPVVGLADQAA